MADPEVLTIEEQIQQVISAIIKLQEAYINQLTKEDEQSNDTIQDYRMLSAKLLEWLDQLDSKTLSMILNSRLTAKLVNVRQASLLIPALRIVKFITTRARKSDIEEANNKVLVKLGERLASSLSWSIEALEENEDTGLYTRKESKEIFDMAATVLQIITDSNTNITRHVILSQENIKFILMAFMKKFQTEKFRNLYDAVESEEECIEDEKMKMKATLKIQATIRMWQQKKMWRKLKNGIVACQRLYRQRLMSDVGSDTKNHTTSVRGANKEDQFNKSIKEVTVRRQELEQKYRRIERLTPMKYEAFQQSERLLAAQKIQRWWRKFNNDQLPNEEIESLKRETAVRVIQAALRRWLLRRRNEPVWSQLLQPRVITEERARYLQLEIDIWQEKNKEHLAHLDIEETLKLYEEGQKRYNQHLTKLPSRRLKEHRLSLLEAQIVSTKEDMRYIPQLHEYRPDMWERFHVLSLPIATAARLEHEKSIKMLGFPSWRRKIDDLLHG